jgi:hypothetical protein
MRFRTMVAGAVVCALAACAGKPPLDEQQKTALGDSLEQFVASRYLGTYEHPNPDTMLSFYVAGEELRVAENGMVYPSRDSLVSAARAFWGRPHLTAHFTSGPQHVTVLNRDAAVYTGMITGGLRDSAGVETPMTLAWTAVFTRTPDGWKIVAEHASMPPAPPAASATPARRR